MATFKSFGGFLLASTALLGAAPAFAQDAADDQAVEDSGGIGEIVVTAQKRAENAQSVPIAISVFSGSALNERAVTNVSQLTAVAPNFGDVGKWMDWVGLVPGQDNGDYQGSRDQASFEAWKRQASAT